MILKAMDKASLREADGEAVHKAVRINAVSLVG